MYVSSTHVPRHVYTFQFYNGYNNPAQYGFSGDTTNNSPDNTQIVYENLANDIFPSMPEKVVFGFCINGCGWFNANENVAVSIMQEVTSVYPCNGGAFFWVAHDDPNGVWSNMVSAQVLQTKGCATPSSAPNEIKSTSIGLGSIDEWQTGSIIGSSNTNHMNSNINGERDDNDDLTNVWIHKPNNESMGSGGAAGIAFAFVIMVGIIICIAASRLRNRQYSVTSSNGDEDIDGEEEDDVQGALQDHKKAKLIYDSESYYDNGSDRSSVVESVTRRLAIEP